ncbi:MAG: ribosome-associated translation inhibitor RaiA [Gammaproteobacteria bacterium]|nr:ribosome-associated translation inhibitor RaiA [Gammaproteobacteria bacterium]
MNIDISGQHMDITPALRSYVESKLQKLKSHYDKIGNSHVVLSVDKLQQKAEATVSYDGGNNLFANAENENMYAAIDALVNKLDRQARKNSEKSNSYRDKTNISKD